MRNRFVVGTFMFILLIAPFPVRAQSEAKLPGGFASKDANVEGLKLHYTMGGHGPAVVLLALPRPRECGHRFCRCWARNSQ